MKMKDFDYDIVVCGGGVAGVAAAIAAARQGAKCVLIEKQCVLGGLATSGLIYIYLPLCDGHGTQITFGLAEEMFRRCPAYGPFTLPKEWGGPENGYGADNPRCRCNFSPAGFSLTLDEMLLEAGVDLWLDTRITGATVENGRVTAVEAVNDSGFHTLRAKCFVDATGQAAVVKLAGGKVLSERNYVTPWIMEMADDHSVFHFTDSLHIRPCGSFSGEYEVPAGYGGKEVTDFCRRSWEIAREHYKKFTPEEQRNNYPVHLPNMPQLRKIARIDGLCTLSDEDHGRHFENSVGVAADWNKPDPGWELPYEALLPRDVKGVVSAGRCIAASGYAWEIFRVIPAAVLSGEVAGVAAALSAAAGISPDDLPIEVLKNKLKENGVRFEMATEK